MNLNFKKIGETGQPIIILHGLFGMGENWLTFAKIFATNHQVYLPDLRNHGHSPHSDSFSYKLMANDLHQFIIENKIEKPIIIGHSMGGKVAMQFAIDYELLFDKLIVVDIAPRFYPVHHTSILKGLNAINLQLLQNRAEANEILKQFEESEGVRQFLMKNLYRNNELNAFTWRMNLAVLTKEIANIGDEITSNILIENATLFVSGSKSSYITDDDRVNIIKIFPNVVFETIEGAGHWVQADKPKEFVEVVSKFFDN